MKDNSILLTIDVEDWFQVENFKKWIPFSTWSYRELRVAKNTHCLLDLFDSIKLNNPLSSRERVTNPTTSNKSFSSMNSNTTHRQHKKVRCTFFVLGWLAQRLPNLVREIHARGHEVASHGYCHHLCNKQTKEELKKDLTNSKKLLEDITGAPVVGYRAPSFAINNEILKTIEDCGYLYDSSYNSFGLHGRYGHVDFSQNDRKGIAIQISKSRLPASSTFYELPISNLKFSPTLARRSGRSYGVKIHDSDSLPRSFGKWSWGETHSTGANLQSSIFNL